MRAIALFVVVAVPAALEAQVKLEVAPFFASYYATAYTSYKAADENERQEAGPGLGLSASYHFTRIVGVQGSFAFVKSGIIPRQPQAAGTINILVPETGAITFASARLTLQPRRSNYFVAFGPGIATRSGKAWKLPGLDHLTNVTAVAAFGIRAHITPEWEFNIGVEGQFYKSDFDGPGSYYDSRLQRDVMVTIGIPYALIGR